MPAVEECRAASQPVTVAAHSCTGDLVADLNRRARDHRLDHSSASSGVGLADGIRPVSEM